MKVKIEEIKSLMLRSLTSRGLTGEDADIVAGALLDAELRGKRTHGVGKFFF